MELNKCRNCNKEISFPKVKYCNEQCSNELRERVKGEYIKYKKDSCEICKRTESNRSDKTNKPLLVHHINGDTRCNNEENLITVCRDCHCFLHSRKFQELIRLINLEKLK